MPLALHGAGPFPARVEVRGEVILSQENFARLRAESETTTDTPFRNPRNTVAGTLKVLPKDVPARVAAVLQQVRKLERELAALKGRLASAQGDDAS